VCGWLQVVNESSEVVYCVDDAVRRLKQHKNINGFHLHYRLDDVSNTTHSHTHHNWRNISDVSQFSCYFVDYAMQTFLRHHHCCVVLVMFFYLHFHVSLHRLHSSPVDCLRAMLFIWSIIIKTIPLLCVVVAHVPLVI